MHAIYYSSFLFTFLIFENEIIIAVKDIVESEQVGCVDNPSGIFTETCGFSEDKGDIVETPIEDIKLTEDGYVLSEKQREYLYGRSVDNTEEFSQQRVVIGTDNSDIFEHWPAGEKIPYEIEKSIGTEAKKAILDAIADIERYTCVRFKSREKKKDDMFLKFFKGNGCWSFIGMRKDKEKVGQKISIGEGCEKKGEVIHQIMHAFGFLNEHTREDRDIYVQINWENILSGIASFFHAGPYLDPVLIEILYTFLDKKKYFRINKQFVQNFLGSDYDYNSIMHYSRKQYSKNGKDTMSIFGCSIKAKKILRVIGQRKGMSAGDRFQINKLFNCPKETKRQSVVDDSFEDLKTETLPTSNYKCS